MGLAGKLNPVKLHRTLKAILFITGMIFSLWAVSCGHEKPKIEPKNIGSTPDLNKDSLSPFWATICKNAEFFYFFDCNRSDCYQIELLNDPFKDFVVITLDLNDSLFDIIHYKKFSLKPSGGYAHSAKTALKKIYHIINPVTKDTIFCIYKDAKTLKVKKNQDLVYFFSTTIWKIPARKGERPELDGECWQVKGRSKNQEVSIERWDFNDSLYYSHVQKLLDLCGEKDYRYKK